MYGKLPDRKDLLSHKFKVKHISGRMSIDICRNVNILILVIMS